MFNVSARLIDPIKSQNAVRDIELTCAVSEKLSRDVALLSSADYEALVEAQSEVIPRVEYLSDTSVIVSEDRGIAGNSIRRETSVIGPMEVSAVRTGDKLHQGFPKFQA